MIHHLAHGPAGPLPIASSLSQYFLDVAAGVTLAAVGYTARQLSRVTRVVEVLVREVMPEGDASLRERMRDAEKALAVTSALVSAQVARTPAPPDDAPPRPRPRRP